MWSVLSAVAWRATSVRVRDGIITISSRDADPKGNLVLELSGKGALGRGGAVQLARILSESASPELVMMDLR